MDPQRQKNRSAKRAKAPALDAAQLLRIRPVLLQCVHEGGGVLCKYFGRITNPRQKENMSSIVCDADLSSEARVLKLVRKHFPGDSIVAEESGLTRGTSGLTWVIDPLDGTSNFVAGLPWFGIQIGVLCEGKAIAAAMYLPLEETLYYAEAGCGALKNGRPVSVSSEKKLSNVLCAFGFDPDRDPARKRRGADMSFNVANHVRNLRTTNSLFDFCYTVDGRLGGCINLCTKIWDIVPVSLILPEAGGRFTSVSGDPLRFDLGADTFSRSYEVLGASRSLHPNLVKATGLA